MLPHFKSPKSPQAATTSYGTVGKSSLSPPRGEGQGEGSVSSGFSAISALFRGQSVLPIWCLSPYFAAVLMSATSLGRAQDCHSRPQQLLTRMTLDEKIGQMTQVDMDALANKSDIQKYFLGSMLSGGNSDPPDISAAGWLKAVEEYKSLALKTRLKIPLLYGID